MFSVCATNFAAIFCKDVLHVAGIRAVIHPMIKTQVIRAFGTIRKTAEALGLTTQAVYAWPEKLPQSLEDKIIGAMHRLGMQLPARGKK